jgi:hypothetical protein
LDKQPEEFDDVTVVVLHELSSGPAYGFGGWIPVGTGVKEQFYTFQLILVPDKAGVEWQTPSTDERL